MQGQTQQTSGPGGISRRQFVSAAASFSAVAAAGSLLTACSSGNGPASVSASGSSGKPSHGGTLRVGLTGGGSGDVISPFFPRSNVDFSRTDQIFDPFCAYTPGGQVQNVLADEITSNADATEWTVRVKKGITFHNGKPLTADDLAYTFQTMLNPKNPGSFIVLLPTVDIKNIKKVDNWTIKVPCTQPLSLFGDTLADYACMVIPTDYDPKSPVGTGPYAYQSFTPGQASVFTRNKDYWQSGLPYTDEVIITDYSDESSQVTALLSGQVDMVNALSTSSMQSVQSQGGKLLIAKGGGYNPFTMRVDQSPFNDPRVREAFRYLVDRTQMLKLVFDGLGTIGNDVFGLYDPEYDTSLPPRPYDPDKAKSLLKAAGHENLHVTLTTSTVAQGTVQMAEVLAQQAQSAGVTVSISNVPYGAYEAKYGSWLFSQDTLQYARYLTLCGITTVTNAPFNTTHFSDPHYDSLYQQAIATLDATRQKALAYEMQQIDYNQGGNIIPFFLTTIDGYASNVHGLVPSRTGFSLNNFDFKNVWLS